MTQTRSSLKSKGPIVTPSYLFYSVKRSWAVMLLIFIAMLLAVTVPTIMQVQSLYERMELMQAESFGGGFTEDEIQNRMQNIFTGIGTILLFVSALSAVFSGCMSFSFIHNKVSAGFFHSLPERRSGHFLASVTASMAAYLFPLAVNMGISFISVAAFGFLDSLVLGLLIKIILISVFYYTVFLAITFFAGSLSGTMPIHAIFSVYLVAVLPVIYYSVLLWLENGISYLRVSYLATSISILNALTPVVRIFSVANPILEMTGNVPVGLIIFDAFMAAIFFVFAYFVYATRPSERAGTPVIYKIVADTVKYTIIFASSLLLAYLFSEIGGGLWLIFGFIAGAVIMLMLANTILNRTPKAMFKGLKGFAVCVAVSVFVLIYASTGGFGTLDYMIPSANSITVQLNGDTYTISDSSAVKAFRGEMEEMLDYFRNNDIDLNESAISYPLGNPEYYYYGSADVEDAAKYTIGTNGNSLKDYQAIASGTVRTVRFIVTYHTPYGIDIPYNYRSVNYEVSKDIIEIIEKYGKKSNGVDEMFADENTMLTYMALEFEIKNDGEIFANEVYQGEYIDQVEKNTLTVNLEFSDFIFETEAEEEAFLADVVRTKLPRFLKEYELGKKEGQIIGHFNMNLAVSSKYRNEYASYFNHAFPLYAEDVAVICDMLVDYVYDFNISVSRGYGVYISHDPSPAEELLAVKKLAGLSPDHFVNAQTEIVDYIIVCDRETNSIITVTEKDKIEEIMSAVVTVGNVSESLISPFVKTDSRYGICVIESEFYNDYTTTYFIEGKTPAFLK